MPSEQPHSYVQEALLERSRLRAKFAYGGCRGCSTLKYPKRSQYKHAKQKKYLTEGIKLVAVGAVTGLVVERLATRPLSLLSIDLPPIDPATF